MNPASHNTKAIEKDFKMALRSMTQRWRQGLILCDVIRLAGLTAAGLVAYAAADYFFALPDGLRIWLGIVLLAVLMLVTTGRLARRFTLTDRDMARHLDKFLDPQRQVILSALELDQQARRRTGQDGELTRFLIRRTVADAGATLAGLTPQAIRPSAELRRELKTALARMLIAGGILMLNPAAARVVLGRVLMPWVDRPPYSHFVFTVSPISPAVLYGGDVELTVEITGAPVSEPVLFLSRYQGRTHRAACFQENNRRFAQRLEKVVSPVDFCFVTGKARSRWHRVKVLYQPAIALASITIEPPPYTRRPIRRFFAGTEPLAGICGSKALLTVTSNRPLLDGLLALRYRNGAGREETVPGVRSGAHAVMFAWIIKEPAELSVVIRDLQGTKNQAPYTLDQKVIPDEPPTATLTDPPGFVLATPNTILPLQGYATDDFGLRQVELIRTVLGYRDRIKSLGPVTSETRLEFDAPVDLHAIGAEVGQVLEFYMEATDQNPVLQGAAASDVVRVQIISEPEYAAVLRARTTLDDFMERYRRMSARMDELRTALSDLQAAAESGKTPAAELERQIRQAAQLHRESAEWFSKMADEFPIFDAERGLAQALRNLITPLTDNARDLDQARSEDPGLGAKLDTLIQRLGKGGRTLAHEINRAQQIEPIARLMELAGVYKTLIARQPALVKRLGRFENHAAPRNPDLLTALGHNQAEIRTALAEFVQNLRKRADQVKSYHHELASSAQEFAEMVVALQIDEIMKNAVIAAENQDGRQASRHSQLALEKMRELLKYCASTPFGGMCQGQLKFEVSENLATTLQEMLQCLTATGGSAGSGAGMGGGMGGDANDGYGTGGHSLMNIPLYGPARSMPGQDRTAAVSGRGGQQGAFCPADGTAKTCATETIAIRDPAPAAGESLPLEQVPEPYREAVQRYFQSGR